MALESSRARGPRFSMPTSGSSRVTSPFRSSRSALKYTPYDPPEIMSPLRASRRPSSSQSSYSGLSDPGKTSLHTYIAPLPMTPGDLTLAVGLQELDMISNVIVNLLNSPPKISDTYFIATTFWSRCGSKF